jgi:hypothetical protein
MKSISEQHFVGRTPWSAAGPPAGFFVLPDHLIPRPKGGSRGTRADQGVCPTQEPHQ